MKFQYLLLIFFLSACSSLAPQTKAFLKAPRTIPDTYKIESVSFIEQSENYCGPATLAMAMTTAGHPIAMETLGAEMITPGKKGTFQEDMLGASRRQGLLAVNIRGVPALLSELAAGNPVIVFQNLGLSWFPKWHYALALGYDLPKEKLIVHSGANAYDQLDLQLFERTWSLANYWGLVILDPAKIPASASDLEIAEGAAGLEQINKVREAEMVYKNLLRKWPESLVALIGMGNVGFTQKKYRDSIKFLSRAAKLHPNSAMVWHNLATAQGAARQVKAARVSAQQAMALANPDEVATYRKSLAEWL